MYATRQQRIFRKRLHRPVVINAKLAFIDIGPGWDRTFERIKNLLRLLAPAYLQPANGILPVRRVLGQGKTIRYDDKRTVGPRMTDPAEVLFVLQLSLSKLSIGPVTHRGKRAPAFDDCPYRLVPG